MMQPAPQTLGVVDLGSNTMRLIIMAYQPHETFRLLDEIKATVRLVEGAGTSNVLQAAPVERAAEALRMFSALADAAGVPRVIGSTLR